MNNKQQMKIKVDSKEETKDGIQIKRTINISRCVSVKDSAAIHQFVGFKAMSDLYKHCTYLLEFGGIGLFYEFYHNKTLKELLGTKGSMLCGNTKILVLFFCRFLIFLIKKWKKLYF